MYPTAFPDLHKLKPKGYKLPLLCKRVSLKPGKKAQK